MAKAAIPNARKQQLRVHRTNGTAQWAALSSSFAQLSDKGYPEHIKTVLRQGGLDPDNITAMAKAAVAQQQAEQTAKLTIQMYHCNHLGTPIALINTQGMIDWAIELDPWGNVLNEFNPHKIDQPIRMQGQQVDRESGLFYNRHRYYDPQMGRYITQDPIGLEGGVNLYGYVNDPLGMIDPLGLAGKSRMDGEMLRRKGEDYGNQKVPQPESVKYPLDKAYDVVDPNKKIWEAASPYDYTQYCDEWEKPKTSCGVFDKKPGMDVKTPSDYLPFKKNTKTSEIPDGYSCSSPTYFPELKETGTAPAADLDDKLDMMRKLQKTRGGSRK
jgi:RHS repeat-associated protein